MAKEFNIKEWQKFHGAKRLIEAEEAPRLKTKTITELANYFLEISKELRKGKYKGITVGEIDKIDDIVAHIMNGAMAGNLEAVISRLDGMLLKYVKEPDPKLGDLATMATDEPEGEEDILDIEPEDALELEPDEEETV